MKKLKTIPLPLDTMNVERLAGPNIIKAFRFELDPSFEMRWTLSDSSLLVVVDSGLVSVRTADQCIVYSAGMLVHIPSGVLFCGDLLTEYASGHCISIPQGRTNLDSDKRVRIFEPTKLMAGICNEISRWSISSETKTAAQKRLADSFLDELSELKEIDHLIVPMPTSPALSIVASQIMNNPSDLEDLNHWARVAGKSRRSFTELFYEETGLSFNVWTQRARVYAAIKLLLLGKSVTEVAAELNYATTSALSQRFGEHMGLTPKEFIAQERERMIRLGNKQYLSLVPARKKQKSVL